MLTKPSPAVLKVLTTLKGHPGWIELIKFFDEELASMYRALAEAQEDCRLRQLQGRAQCIREFLALVTNAQELSEKTRK
jgi:hypothetical protein